MTLDTSVGIPIRPSANFGVRYVLELVRHPAGVIWSRIDRIHRDALVTNRDSERSDKRLDRALACRIGELGLHRSQPLPGRHADDSPAMTSGKLLRKRDREQSRCSGVDEVMPVNLVGDSTRPTVASSNTPRC